MKDGRRIAWTLAVAVSLAATMALAPRSAEAHGRGGRGRSVIVGGFYGPYFGLGWSPFFDPFWGPYPGAYYRPAGGVDMNVAMIAGVGAIDLDAKPNRADVWVDGEYVGEARDLDGYPSYLWLKPGAHRIAVYKGGYRTFEETVLVQRAMKRTLKVRLEPGDSAPPGPKPQDDKLSEPLHR
jgi:hypothetical protein